MHHHDSRFVATESLPDELPFPLALFPCTTDPRLPAGGAFVEAHGE
jgi:hypothetical protein